MKIEFDAGKDDANRAKHGISLEAATEIDLLRSTVVEDMRRDYGERRFIAYGQIKGRLHVLCFTWRGENLRAIGLRRANKRERQRHDRQS